MVRMQQYVTDLLASCAECVLGVPLQFVDVEMLLPALTVC